MNKNRNIQILIVFFFDKNLQNVIRRKSLPQPPKSDVTWNEYINSSAGHPPCIGRSPVLKESVKLFKANVAMVREGASDFIARVQKR